MAGINATTPVAVNLMSLALGRLSAFRIVAGLNSLVTAGKTAIADRAISAIDSIAIAAARGPEKVRQSDEFIITVGRHLENPTDLTRREAISTIARNRNAVDLAISAQANDDPAAIIEAGAMAMVDAEKAAKLDRLAGVVAVADSLNSMGRRGRLVVSIGPDNTVGPEDRKVVEAFMKLGRPEPAAPVAPPTVPTVPVILHRLKENEVIPLDGFSILETDRFEIRIGRDATAPEWLRIGVTEQNWKTSGKYHYNAYIRNKWTTGYVGSIQIQSFNRQILTTDDYWDDVYDPMPNAVEISYQILLKQQNQGIMSEALGALLEYLKNIAGTELFIANTDHSNRSSRKLLEKLGFELLHNRGSFGLYYLGALPK